MKIFLDSRNCWVREKLLFSDSICLFKKKKPGFCWCLECVFFPKYYEELLASRTVWEIVGFFFFHKTCFASRDSSTTKERLYFCMFQRDYWVLEKVFLEVFLDSIDYWFLDLKPPMVYTIAIFIKMSRRWSFL